MIIRLLGAPLTVALLVALIVQAGGSSAGGAEAASEPSRAAVRGCRERVESRTIVPDRKVDTVIGPMAFIRLPHVYRSYATQPLADLRSYADDDGFTGMKSIGVLRSGARVTLSVPRRQRRWLEVVYDYPHHEGGHKVTLRACSRLASRRARERECGWQPRRACRAQSTQFNGGVGINFVRAPKRGICAELIVRSARGKRVRKHLFQPSPGDC